MAVVPVHDPPGVRVAAVLALVIDELDVVVVAIPGTQTACGDGPRQTPWYGGPSSQLAATTGELLLKLQDSFP